MANFANGPEQTGAWISTALGRLRAEDQMLIVPLAGIETEADIQDMLAAVVGFVAGKSGGSDGPQGMCFLNSERCVDDALRDLAGGLVSVAELSAAIDARADSHEEGKTVVLKTKFGDIIVDRALFAAKTGLALQRSLDSALTVYVYSVADQARAGVERKVFVAVRPESGAVALGEGALAAGSLEAFFPALEERRKLAFDNMAYFDLPGIGSGSQLLATPGFREVLGWLRGGYTHRLSRSPDGTVYMSY